MAVQPGIVDYFLDVNGIIDDVQALVSDVSYVSTVQLSSLIFPTVGVVSGSTSVILPPALNVLGWQNDKFETPDRMRSGRAYWVHAYGSVMLEVR